MYNCRQPPCEPLGFRPRLTPRRAAGGFEGSLGGEGVRVQPPKSTSVTVRGLTLSPSVEGRRSNAFSRSRGRRRQGLPKALDTRRGDASSQPSPSLVPAQGREHCALDEGPWAGMGRAWVAACIRVGSLKNAFFFSSPKERRID